PGRAATASDAARARARRFMADSGLAGCSCAERRFPRGGGLASPIALWPDRALAGSPAGPITLRPGPSATGAAPLAVAVPGITLAATSPALNRATTRNGKGDHGMSEPVGILGLGLMGGAMARRLIACGRTVVGFDPQQDKLKAAAEAGVETASSPAEVAARCETLLVCVTSTAAVEKALLGPDGVAEAS